MHDDHGVAVLGAGLPVECMGQSYRVLIVDDRPEARARIRARLEGGEGPRYEIAETEAASAIVAIEAENPDCVVIDLAYDGAGKGLLEDIVRTAERRLIGVIARVEADDRRPSEDLANPLVQRIRMDESDHRTREAVRRSAELARLTRQLDHRERELETTRIALREARDQLDHLRRAKCDFLGMISHDIRAPLGVIMGSLTEFSHEESLEDHHRMLLRLMRRSSQRLLGFADKILQLSVIESDDFVPQKMSFDLTALIREVAADLSAHEDTRGIDLAIDAPTAVEVTADRDRVAQMIAHLLSNAVRHAESKASVRVEKRGDQVRVEVLDDGPGLTAERLERIVEHWSRGDLPDGKRGIGLGLSIVRAVAHAHGGDVAAENLPDPAGGKPQGARFVVSLPTMPR